MAQITKFYCILYDLLEIAARIQVSCICQNPFFADKFPDENRQRVIDLDYILSIIRLFQLPPIAHVAIPVLYNICSDFGKSPGYFLLGKYR